MKNAAVDSISLFEMLLRMDVSAIPIRLHPGAKDYLFQNFQRLRRIFSDVLGQVETDYLSIAFINQRNELFFISSIPSIEQNLIDKNLWYYDGCYQEDFINQNEPALWVDLYQPEHAQALSHYKKDELRSLSGFSIPSHYLEYRVIFSYGFRTITSIQKIKKQQDKFIAMGKFCLKKIIESIPLLDQCKPQRVKPKLTLVINNKELYENAT